MNPLLELHSYGQSFWYDNIRRSLLLDGTIASLIDQDGLRGMTSNPSIFEKAIGSAGDYDGQIRELAAAGLDTKAIYEELAVSDIASACDLFADLYDASDGRDGYVSLEVSPHLANDEEATVSEAKRLSAAVGRPNVMIKVPATEAGVRALRRLIGSGININVTLMFSMKHYQAVAEAYIAGLTDYRQGGGEPKQIASVASFFVSRVDTAVDKLLAQRDDGRARDLLGRTAVANSKVVYQQYKSLFQGQKFQSLRQTGGRAQRLLWASTSTKNPAYPDTLYVDELIGPDTVNTMPPATIDAFRDHGQPDSTLEKDLDQAYWVLETVAEMGVDLEDVTDDLQLQGLAAFSASYDQLLESLNVKVQALVTTP